MTVMTDREILAAIKTQEIVVHPFDKSQINPTSLDVRLGVMFGRVKAKMKGALITGGGPVPFNINGDLPKVQQGTYKSVDYKILDPRDKESFETEELWYPDGYLLAPGEFILGSLMEDISLSDRISACIKGKSSLGRLGLTNSSMAGFVDAGWSGVLTIELKNEADYGILLTPGMKIGQIVFFKHDTVEQGYDKKGRYLGQPAGCGSKGV